MILGLVASEDTTPAAPGSAPAAALDFVAASYQVDGAGVALSELIADESFVDPGNGLATTFDQLQIAMTGALLALMIADGWTAVVEWLNVDNFYCEPFTIADAAFTIGKRCGAQDDPGNFTVYDWIAGGVPERDCILDGAAAATVHCVAVTRTNAKLAIALDGGGVTATIADQASLAAVADSAWFGGHDSATSGLGRCVIKRFAVYAALADELLPALSVPVYS